jgi:hypothetical protein
MIDLFFDVKRSGLIEIPEASKISWDNRPSDEKTAEELDRLSEETAPLSSS